MREEWICPKCGRSITDYPAISRRDNATEICSDCGTAEALEDFYGRNDRIRETPLPTKIWFCPKCRIFPDVVYRRYVNPIVSKYMWKDGEYVPFEEEDLPLDQEDEMVCPHCGTVLVNNEDQ